MRLALTRERGRKSGEAFAELPGREAERAVRALDRRSLGSRYIEVFVSSASEAGEALAGAPTALARRPCCRSPGGGTRAEGGGLASSVRAPLPLRAMGSPIAPRRAAAPAGWADRARGPERGRSWR